MSALEDAINTGPDNIEAVTCISRKQVVAYNGNYEYVIDTIPTYVNLKKAGRINKEKYIIQPKEHAEMVVDFIL